MTVEKKKFQVIGKVLSLGHGEITKAEVIEASSKADAEQGFLNKFMAIEIMESWEITNDEHLDYLERLLSDAERKKKNAMNNDDEDDFIISKEMVFTLNAIIIHYKNTRKEVK